MPVSRLYHVSVSRASVTSLSRVCVTCLYHVSCAVTRTATGSWCVSFVSLFGDTFGEQGDTVRTKQRVGFRGEHDDVLDFVANMMTCWIS